RSANFRLRPADTFSYGVRLVLEFQVTKTSDTFDFSERRQGRSQGDVGLPSTEWSVLVASRWPGGSSHKINPCE
ncbi:MAG: hypothetical protein MK316_13305, partial [Pseudomonadales bacterium]|nr:hypothetical protein [Pseudomonadales bacterium]